MSQTKLPSLNKVIIVGNLTRDPELRFTQAGVPVANFKIASNKRYKDSLGMVKEDVCYIGVVAWEKLAESCRDHLKKGSAVLVEGELRSRLKENEDGSKRNFVEIKAFFIQFLDKDKKGEGLALEGSDSLSAAVSENERDSLSDKP